MRLRFEELETGSYEALQLKDRDTVTFTTLVKSR